MVSLEDLLEETWAQLELAQQDTKHGFRKLCLATVNGEGLPQGRMVISRKFEKASRILMVYTDPRTPKWDELRKNPLAQVTLWDEESKVQLRCDCRAELLEEGELWEEARESVPEHMAGDYAAVKIPGEKIENWEEGWELGGTWYFGVICLRIEKMDWLKLSREGHQRACFSWQNGVETHSWKQP